MFEDLECEDDSIIDNDFIKSVTCNATYILLAYNNNPYMHKDEYSDYYKLLFKKFIISINAKVPYKAFKIKKIRNRELKRDINNTFKIKTKQDKKFINDNKNNNTSHKRALSYIRIANIKKIIKDPNNINKLLQNAFVGYYNFNDFSEVTYLKALIKEFGETNTVNAIAKDPMLYYDTYNNYKKVIEAVPNYELPNKRLRLKDLHDKIAKDAIKVKQTPKHYEYEKELLEVYDNKVIDNILFTIAKSNNELTNIGSYLSICVGGYNQSVERGENFIVSMILLDDNSKNNNYVGCLEITKDLKLVQAKAKYNNLLSDDYQNILKEYCLKTNTKPSTRDVSFRVNANIINNSKYKDKIKLKVTTEKVNLDSMPDNNLEELPF